MEGDAARKRTAATGPPAPAGSGAVEAAVSAVNQPAVRGPGGFHHRFGERRVRVDRSRHLVVAAFELAGVYQLLDQVGRLHRADVGAQDLAVLLVADDLHQAAAVAVDRWR